MKTKQSANNRLAPFAIIYNLCICYLAYMFGEIFSYFLVFNYACSIITLMLCSYAKIEAKEIKKGNLNIFHKIFLHIFLIPTTLTTSIVMLGMGCLGTIPMYYSAKNGLTKLRNKTNEV